MFCSNCGSPVRDGANFCCYCGNNLINDAAPELEPVIQQEQEQEQVQVVEVVQEPEKEAAPVFVEHKGGRGPGIAALIFGIFALIVPVIGLVFGIIAVICAAAGMKRQGKGLAIAGLVTGLVGILSSILIMAVGFAVYQVGSEIVNDFPSGSYDFYYDYEFPRDWDDSLPGLYDDWYEFGMDEYLDM